MACALYLSKIIRIPIHLTNFNKVSNLEFETSYTHFHEDPGQNNGEVVPLSSQPDKKAT
jgi:hypothetical protein